MKDLLTQTIVDLPKPNTIVSGQVISLSKNAVMIDLGSLGTGIVYPGEFYDNTSLQKALQPGQTVSAVFLSIEDEEGRGFRELSLKRAQMTTAWEDIKDKKEKGEIVTLKIMNINKGGLIVELNGIQGFLPLSQLSPEHYPKIEGGDITKIVQALQKFRNQDFQVKILDFSEEERRLIVSEKAVNQANIQKELEKFNVGDVISGTVTDVTDFGAFVSIVVPESSGVTVEGLIHISEIDWKIIDNPRDILKSGQNVEAKIITIEDGKVSLSLKALKDDPWKNANEKYTVGQTIPGIVAKITNYGVMVSLSEEGLTGLIPSSEFGTAKPSDTMVLGETKQVTIVSIDSQEHKMLLTLSK